MEYKNTEYKLNDLTIVVGNAPPTGMAKPETLAEKAEAKGVSITHMWVKEAFEIDASAVLKKSGDLPKYNAMKELQQNLERAIWTEINKRGPELNGGGWVGGQGLGVRKHETIEVTKNLVPNSQEVAEDIAKNVLQSMGVDLSTGVEASKEQPAPAKRGGLW